MSNKKTTKPEAENPEVEQANIQPDYVKELLEKLRYQQTGVENLLLQMKDVLQQAGKNQEQFISNCSETLSESTKALDSTIEKLQQKIMKIIINIYSYVFSIIISY